MNQPRSSFTPLRTVVLPVAGLGTRFLPATKAIPKEMLVLLDKPLIQYAVEEAKAAGIERFIFITSQGKSAIEAHFSAHPLLEQQLKEKGKTRELLQVQESSLEASQAIFLHQQVPLGLGHAVWCARHWLQDEPFALLLPDDVILSDRSCLRQLMDCYEQNPLGNYVAVQEVPLKDVHRYGVLDPEQTPESPGEVLVKARGVVEKPSAQEAPSTTAIIGRYILQPRILFHLSKQEKGAQGEIQLTDSFNPLIQESPFYGVRIQGRRFDCGTKEGLLEATLAYAYADESLRGQVDHFFNQNHKGEEA